MKSILRAVAGAAMSLAAMPGLAQVAITEVAPWSSGNSRIEADWFELTKRGASAVDISGWRMDYSTLERTLLASIARYHEHRCRPLGYFPRRRCQGDRGCALESAFSGTWFGGSAPSAL